MSKNKFEEFDTNDVPNTNQITLAVALIASGLFLFLFTTGLSIGRLAGYGFPLFTIATFAWFRYIAHQQGEVK